MARFVAHLLLATLAFLASLSLASAYLTDDGPHYRTIRRSYAGMDVMCQLHRRNCPGGFRKRLADVGQGKVPREETITLPRPSAVLSPLSQLLSSLQQHSQASSSPVGMAANDNGDGDVHDDDTTNRRLRQRLVSPIRAAILELLRHRGDSVFSSSSGH